MRNEIEEIDRNATTFYVEHISLLNTSQQVVSDILRQYVDYGDGDFFFIGAPGGTGKTFLECSYILRM